MRGRSSPWATLPTDSFAILPSRVSTPATTASSPSLLSLRRGHPLSGRGRQPASSTAPSTSAAAASYAWTSSAPSLPHPNRLRIATKAPTLTATRMITSPSRIRPTTSSSTPSPVAYFNDVARRMVAAVFGREGGELRGQLPPRLRGGVDRPPRPSSPPPPSDGGYVVLPWKEMEEEIPRRPSSFPASAVSATACSPLRPLRSRSRRDRLRRPQPGTLLPPTRPVLGRPRPPARARSPTLRRLLFRAPPRRCHRAQGPRLLNPTVLHGLAEADPVKAAGPRGDVPYMMPVRCAALSVRSFLNIFSFAF